MHVACVLTAIGELKLEGGEIGKPGDFTLGVHNILWTLESALNMHRNMVTICQTTPS